MKFEKALKKAVESTSTVKKLNTYVKKQKKYSLAIPSANGSTGDTGDASALAK